MASIRVTCPKCDERVRLSERPEDGEKVKCPECGKGFVPELDDEDDHRTRIQAKSTAKGTSSSRSDPDDEPRRKRSRADEDDDRGRRKGREDDDDGRGKKAKAKPKSGMMMYLMIGGGVFGIGACLFSCALFGVAGFVWPGFFLSKNELLAYVPPDSNFLIGGNSKQLKEKFAAFNDMMMRDQGFNNNGVPEMEDLLARADNFVVAFNTNDFKGMFGGARQITVTFAISGAAADVDRLRRSNAVGESRTVNGQTFHRFTPPGGGGFGPNGQAYIAFPNKTTVVISTATEADMAVALNRAKKGPPTSPVIELARSVDKSPLWLALAFDGDMQRGMRNMFEESGKRFPTMRDAAPAAENAKGMTFTLDMYKGKDVKLTASIKCKNSADAGKMKIGLEDGWAGVKGLLNLAGGNAPPDKARAQELMIRDLNSMAFKTSGDTATATLTFAFETIDELQRVGKNGRFNQGPFPFQPFPQPQPQPQPFPQPQPQPKFDPFDPNRLDAPALGNPIQAFLGAGGFYQQNNRLTNLDPRNKQNKIYKLYSVQLEAKKTYQIDLISADFDAYLYLIDDTGTILARDDDSGGNLNARIIYTPARAGTYYIHATSLNGISVGNYTFSVRKF
jgi:hypothetical protein